MRDSTNLELSTGRYIPADELVARASRSGGPGGQHVNTSSTRVELAWNVTTSRVLTDEERARLLLKLGSRLDRAGVLRVVASDTRSQRQNRELAAARLAALVRTALVVPRRRKATKAPRAAREQRLEEKKRAARRKSERRTRDWD